MENLTLYKNYTKSLEQKYNAVCLDIDGTLTIKNSKSIDNKAIEMIADLLKKKIPVVLITGRGETGLDDLKNDIYKRLKDNEEISNSDIKRIYVLINDGARLFYTDCDFLDSNVYISTDKELNQLVDVNDYILNLSNSPYFKKCFIITYSKDFKTDKIINIRLSAKYNDEKMIDSVYYKIIEYINNKKYSSIHITRGIYKGKMVFQIGTATKDQAIKITEKMIGVPQNSMIRIGDCGDFRGNDYAMLNCNQGYSVDKTNGTVDSCFPVYDDQGNIIKGIDATLQLIQKAKVLPTVCLEKIEKNDYKRQFANVERNIVQGRKKMLNKYNEIISLNFNNCSGIDDLFIINSGSVIVPMYEIELLDNNPLKELWLSSNNNNLIYSIRDDNNYLLRGATTYYYFIANRESLNGVDITTKKNVLCWYNNYIRFLNESINAVETTDNLNGQTNKKLVLGIMDNCRNILLILTNHYLISNYNNKNVLLDISSNNDKISMGLYNALMKTEKMMSKICFEEHYVIDKDSIVEVINKTKEVLLLNLNLELNNDVKENYSKEYRAYREIDNFAENYIAVSLYKENCTSKQFVNACGLSYGGIELPLLAKIIDQHRIEKLLLLSFNKEVSGYTNKQLIDLRKFNINNFGGLINSECISNSNIDLFDDNVLTGKTLQLAINSLYDCNITVKNICIVRYPSINRIDQMFFYNSAAIDYKLFFDYIYGLCFNSPYSWKDNEWINNKGKIDYTDTLGVFDLNRRKIVECLLKNHAYSESSEVAEYKRRLLK